MYNPTDKGFNEEMAVLGIVQLRNIRRIDD